MIHDPHNREKQYFIAVIPPPPAFEEAQQLKHYFKEKYNSKASLNSPPHITLHMPFRWKEDKEAVLLNSLSAFSPGVLPFTLSLKNFSAFPPRVIFIDVAPSPDLAVLQKTLQRFCRSELNLFNAAYKDQAFHPHLTLAFRDLRKSRFEEAWNEFKGREFSATFTVDRFQLLKHNGREWEQFKEYTLRAVPRAPDKLTSADPFFPSDK